MSRRRDAGELQEKAQALPSNPTTAGAACLVLGQLALQVLPQVKAVGGSQREHAGSHAGEALRKVRAQLSRARCWSRPQSPP